MYKAHTCSKFILFLVLTSFSVVTFAQTYVVGIESSFLPLAYVSEGEFKDIAPDAVRAIEENQGFDVEFKSMSFPSLIPALEAGKIDILATGLTVSKKRAEVIDFTIPWWHINLVSLVKKDSGLNAITALCCGSDVGAQSGSTNNDWLTDNLVDNGIDINIRTYPDDTTGVQDLQIGRIDAYFIDSDTASLFIQKNSDSLRIAGVINPHPVSVYALGVKKGNDELLEILNKGEVELYESGEWADIIHEYLPGVAVGDVPGVLPPGISSYEEPIPGYSD